MTYTVTVYQSGNSNVIMLPAKLGIKAGGKFTLDVKVMDIYSKRKS